MAERDVAPSSFRIYFCRERKFRRVTAVSYYYKEWGKYFASIYFLFSLLTRPSVLPSLFPPPSFLPHVKQHGDVLSLLRAPAITSKAANLKFSCDFAEMFSILINPFPTRAPIRSLSHPMFWQRSKNIFSATKAAAAKADSLVCAVRTVSMFYKRHCGASASRKIYLNLYCCSAS